jgi:hypothetical protein
LTALGRVLAPIFKLCFPSSEPFVGVCDLGPCGAAARVDRRDPPVLLSLLLSARYRTVIEQR